MPEIATRDDPYRGYNFKLEIPGIAEAHFTQCSGLSARVHAIDYRAGGEGQIVRKLPGPVEYSEVTLRYGLTDSLLIWDWFTQVTVGVVERKNVSIVVLGDDGATLGPQWDLFEAWPTSWRATDLDALGKLVAIESVSIVFERIERGS